MTRAARLPIIHHVYLSMSAYELIQGSLSSGTKSGYFFLASGVTMMVLYPGKAVVRSNSWLPLGSNRRERLWMCRLGGRLPLKIKESA